MSDNGNKSKIISGPKLYFQPDPRGLGWEFFRCFNKHRNKIAQVCASTSKRETYSELLQKCIRAAIHMKKRGLKAGDIVVLCTGNHLNSAVPWIAGLFLGCKVASLDPRISLPDTIHLLSEIKEEVGIVFTSQACEELMENGLEAAGIQVEVVIYENTKKNTSFGEFLLESEEEIGFKPYAEGSCKDIAIIFFSSGTTGLPKGICTSSYALAHQGNNISMIGFNCTMAISYASLYWISTAVVLTATSLVGGTRLLCGAFDPLQTWYLIDKYKVTLIFLSPILAMYILRGGRPEGVNTTNVNDIMVGGGPFAGNFVVQLRDLFPGTNVNLVYGQTEVAGVITAFRPAFREDMMLMYDKPASSGRAFPGVDYKICDPESEEVLGINQRGELLLKCKFAMNGYYNRDASANWDDQGWLRTGDIAYYDEDECFYIVDRMKEMLKYQSYHVAPAIIEAVLQKHPAVSLGVVIGIPHEVDGDHPMGVVVLNQNTKSVTPQEIQDFVDSKVDNFQKLRAGVKFVHEIPFTASGKVRRRYLRQLILNGEI